MQKFDSLLYKTGDLGSVSSTRLDTMFKSTVGALVFLLAAVSAGRFGCHNPHPYCKKDNHPKEACTDWGEGWKGWMEENCPEKCGKCGGGGGGRK